MTLLTAFLACGDVDLPGGHTGNTSGIPTSFQLDYWTEPAPAVALEPTELWYSILDQDGLPVELLQQSHTRMVHVLVVSSDLSSFEHKHHEDQNPVTADDLRAATFHFTEAFPYSGDFLLSFQFAVANEVFELQTSDSVQGDTPQLPSYSADFATEVAVSGVRATLTWDVLPAVGVEAQWNLHLTDDAGVELTDLVQWLGADAHSAVVRADLGFVAHTHAWFPGMEDVPPDHTMPHTYLGPDLPFRFVFPTAGVHKMWIQFARESAPEEEITVPFLFTVTL